MNYSISLNEIWRMILRIQVFLNYKMEIISLSNIGNKILLIKCYLLNFTS